VDFGLPLHYLIQPEQGRPYRVHHSRVLRFCGPEVPRWEFQANMWWGLSEVELIFEELRKRDNVSWSIANLCFRANIMVIHDDQIAALVSGLGISGEAAQRAYASFQAMNQMMSNQGLLALTTKGSLDSHQFSFGGLDAIEKNFMVNVAGAVGIPFSRLFGQTVTGLGQSNEGDEGIYNDKVKQKQERELSPQLWKLLPVIAMSTWGKVPQDLDHKWLPVQSPSNQERSELGRSNTDAVLVGFNAGLIPPKTALQELKQQADVTGLWSNITTEQISKASMEIAPDKSGEMPGGAGGAGGLEALMGGGAPGEGGGEPQPGETPEQEQAEGDQDVENLQKMIAATAPDKRQKLIEGMLATIQGRSAEGGQGAEQMGGEEEGEGPKTARGPAGTVKVRQPRPQSGGNAKDAMPSLKEGQIARLDPRKLVFRKYNLNKMHEVSQRFASGVDLPIVVIDRPSGVEILDGAHRTVWAQQQGWNNIGAIPISGTHYDDLKEQGFSDDAIGFAIMEIAGRPEAAIIEVVEKPDQPVESEGMKALSALREMMKPKPVLEDEMDVGEIPPIPETTGYAEGEANVGVPAG
jgi:hypothetical protein